MFTFSALKRHLIEAAREALDLDDAGLTALAAVRARDCLWLSRQITALRLVDASTPMFRSEAR
jgi:hypothetical protein